MTTSYDGLSVVIRSIAYGLARSYTGEEQVVARHPATASGFTLLPEDEASGFEGTEAHLARHDVTPLELDQVFMNHPVWLRNKRNRAANWRMLGRTDGGRAIDVKVRWDETRDELIPVTAWDASTADQLKYHL